MKKIFLILLISSCTFSLYAQESPDTTMNGKTKIKTDNSKTKIKDDKTKSKDENARMKVKDNDNINSDNESKIKVKDGKMKVKDADGKLKVKGNEDMNSGTMNNSGMVSGTTTTSTNVNVVTIGGWTTNPANLPVVGNNVPADVVANVKNKYGATIYDIKQIKSTSGQTIYVVRIMENGGMRADYVGADGNTVPQ